jgi:hypothetical protein
MSQPREDMTEVVESIRRRLFGTDLSDSDIRSLQLHMTALDQWARLGDSLMATGHDHDHMDDHDHAMLAPMNVVATSAEFARRLDVGTAQRTEQ